MLTKLLTGLLALSAASLGGAHQVEASSETRASLDDGSINIPDIKVTAAAPFIQCGHNEISWDDDRIPADQVFQYSVYANIYWREEDDNGAITEYASSAYFGTPSKSLQWQVDFPAGSIVNFHLSAWNTRSVYVPGRSSNVSSIWLQGQSANYTILPGLSSKCIPSAHYPIIVELPNVETQVTECAISRIKWRGGHAPYTLHLRPTNLDRVSDTYYSSDMVEDADGKGAYIDLKVDYPVGTTIGVRVRGEDFRSSFFNEQYLKVNRAADKANCIPRVHKYGRRRWFQHPAVIAGFVLGGLVVLALLGFAGQRGYQYWLKRRGGAITLE